MKRVLAAFLITLGCVACGPRIGIPTTDPVKDGCEFSLGSPRYNTTKYKVVNNASLPLEVGDIERSKSQSCSDEARYYPEQRTVAPGTSVTGYWLDPYGDNDYYYDLNGNRIDDFASHPLLAIRLNPTTIAYYTGYPPAFSASLSAWLLANQSRLNNSFYSPRPTISNLDAQGLVFVLSKHGRSIMGWPPIVTSEWALAYTSLDPINKPYLYLNSTITFTVNGPNKSDVVITYEGTLQ